MNFSKTTLFISRLNHDPSIPWEGPTKRDEFLIQEVVAGLQTFLSSVKKFADESSTKIQTIEVTVRKNFLYRADELIRESEREKVEKEIILKEKELEKEKKRDERKRKREEEEKKKQEREDLQAEKKAKKVKELEEKEKKKEENSCKGDCGRVCRNGGSWMGCEFCDVFWVCPVCYRSPIMKQTMAKHEKRCQKL